jgi:hypothetical protein
VNNRIRKHMKTNKALLTALFMTLALAAGVSTVQAQVTFAPATNYPVGTAPYSVAAADVNGDGKLDLISANYGFWNWSFGYGTVSVLTNDGSGSFVTSSSLVMGDHPMSVTAADVNGDGKMDVVCPRINDGGNGTNLSVMTNNGSGSFVTASSPVVGSSPRWAVAADVNGDDKVDLISANGNANNLTVLTNNGSGGFATASSPGVGTSPLSVTAADVNGDGKVDLISANYGTNTLTVLTNNGNGSGGFTTASSPTVGLNPHSVTAADVNGDGKVDLISANFAADTLSVLTNDGSGGFVTASTLSVGAGPRQVAVADINGDGKLDLISANAKTNTLSVLTNNGSGGFVTASTLDVGDTPFSVTAADVNGDGKMDLISGVGSLLRVFVNTTIFPMTLTNIVVTPANTIIGAGTNQQFTSTGYFADGSSGVLASTNGLVWSSSNPSIASIDTNGVATGLSVGTATITATSGSISNSTGLTVVVIPTISTNPVSVTVSPGGTATLSVSADGGVLSYQWQCNGTNIDGATDATLTITNLSSTNIGSYTVTVSNPAGSVTSQAATLASVDIKMFAGVIVNGPLGSNYLIEASSNLLSDWTTLTNVALPTQPYIFIDYDSPADAQQFYRAVPMP